MQQQLGAIDTQLPGFILAAVCNLVCRMNREFRRSMRNFVNCYETQPVFAEWQVVLQRFAVVIATGFLAVPALAQTDENGDSARTSSAQELERIVEERRVDEAALNEDPEAQRRVAARNGDPADTDFSKGAVSLDIYGSVRAHIVNTFDVDTFVRETNVSDGQSRIGARADWEYTPGWYVFGRAEFGFDIVDQFSTRGKVDGNGGMTTRLAFAGIDSENLTLVYGENWSAYYQIAGITDRFAIFGGSASGVYNAGTSGGATGTGRAEDVVQARLFVEHPKWMSAFKPFNLNMQYQRSQAIPRVEGAEYEYGYGASAWLETKTEFGIGLAYNRSRVNVAQLPALIDSGIDGDAVAAAISSRAFGTRWYVSMLYALLDNIETTDQGKYFNGYGFELYAQWEVLTNWWVIGGINNLQPYADDPNAGEFRTRYAVVGGRYTFDSFKRMLYLEYRIDDSRFVDGRPLKNEITVGVRWDFGE
jgi:hypothetical protein